MSICPDCNRSDSHHPLCPSGHLPLEYDIDGEADEARDRERDFDERSGVVS